PPPPPPPPPAAPEVIEIIEDDDEEVEETVIESSEADQLEEIAEIEDIQEVVEEEVVENVPFAIIENVPVYPGCEKEKNNEAKKKCLEAKIQQFVQRRFNTDLASQLGLRGVQSIMTTFTIDASGKITNIQIRAPHPRLEREARSVIENLPSMEPGSQRGRKVSVSYTLPIRFEVR